MPTYEYECAKCKHAFEQFQSMRDEPLKKCPKCRGKVKRLVGRGAGVIFKGGGFYQTDYRSASYQSGAKADSSSSSVSTPAASSIPAATSTPPAASAPSAPKKAEKSDGAKKSGGGKAGG
jgi:putative FmdB family regulatory protein